MTMVFEVNMGGSPCNRGKCIGCLGRDALQPIATSLSHPSLLTSKTCGKPQGFLPE